MLKGYFSVEPYLYWFIDKFLEKECADSKNDLGDYYDCMNYGNVTDVTEDEDGDLHFHFSANDKEYKYICPLDPATEEPECMPYELVKHEWTEYEWEKEEIEVVSDGEKNDYRYGGCSMSPAYDAGPEVEIKEVWKLVPKSASTEEWVPKFDEPVAYHKLFTHKDGSTCQFSDKWPYFMNPMLQPLNPDDIEAEVDHIKVVDVCADPIEGATVTFFDNSDPAKEVISAETGSDGQVDVKEVCETIGIIDTEDPDFDPATLDPRKCLLWTGSFEDDAGVDYYDLPSGYTFNVMATGAILSVVETDNDYTYKMNRATVQVIPALSEEEFKVPYRYSFGVEKFNNNGLRRYGFAADKRPWFVSARVPKEFAGQVESVDLELAGQTFTGLQPNTPVAVTLDFSKMEGDAPEGWQDVSWLMHLNLKNGGKITFPREQEIDSKAKKLLFVESIYIKKPDIMATVLEEGETPPNDGSMYAVPISAEVPLQETFNLFFVDLRSAGGDGLVEDLTDQINSYEPFNEIPFNSFLVKEVPSTLVKLADFKSEATFIDGLANIVPNTLPVFIVDNGIPDGPASGMGAYMPGYGSRYLVVDEGTQIEDVFQTAIHELGHMMNLGEEYPAAEFLELAPIIVPARDFSRMNYHNPNNYYSKAFDMSLCTYTGNNTLSCAASPDMIADCQKNAPWDGASEGCLELGALYENMFLSFPSEENLMANANNADKGYAPSHIMSICEVRKLLFQQVPEVCEKGF